MFKRKILVPYWTQKLIYNRGIELDFVDLTGTFARFKCRCGQRWVGEILTVLNGLGCPECESRERRFQFGKTLVPCHIETLKSLFIEVLGDPYGQQTQLKCQFGHEWSLCLPLTRITRANTELKCPVCMRWEVARNRAAVEQAKIDYREAERVRKSDLAKINGERRALIAKRRTEAIKHRTK